MKKNILNENKTGRVHNRELKLAICDFIPYCMSFYFMFIISPSEKHILDAKQLVLHFCVCLALIIVFRLFFGVYRQIWRFAHAASYLKLILSDMLAGASYYCLDRLSGNAMGSTFVRMFAFVELYCFCCVGIRLIYQYLYHFSSGGYVPGGIVKPVYEISVAFGLVSPPEKDGVRSKTRVAIVGAGRVGAALAEDLMVNPSAPYYPVCFFDVDEEKVGRDISNIPVFSAKQASGQFLASLDVQEVIFAIPNVSSQKRRQLYERYSSLGFKVKTYDYPLAQSSSNGRRTLREFDIEDLLFRDEKELDQNGLNKYYENKIIAVTGGGGSIGSEICRQLARYSPQKLVIADIYENGAYDLQQELKIKYRDQFDVAVEIVNVCDKEGMENLFSMHKPDVVIHAAAHKHVPLMEHNPSEAVKNNIFGTLNTVELSEKYHVKKFIMVSTDKAVNPTNVMGATKRMCEMIVLGRKNSTTEFSATRFGNVLGSNGSVIPLFKKQIENGGPITITDKRIIRYFMTIPEASNLVLQSGAMAKNGELYVLDMGLPVKILDLAENLIKLSGLEPYRDIDIVETGLRPGEKLYEELLMKSDSLQKTANSQIFIEVNVQCDDQKLNSDIEALRRAAFAGDDAETVRALRNAVDTFKTPEEVNNQ